MTSAKGARIQKALFKEIAEKLGRSNPVLCRSCEVDEIGGFAKMDELFINCFYK